MAEVGSILMDNHEPPQMLHWLQQVVPCRIEHLNEQGYADYLWRDHNGRPVHVERKTWGELQGSLDKVEKQLYGHLLKNPDARLIFLLEGLATPEPGGTAVWKESGKYFVCTYHSFYPLQLTLGWLYQIEKYFEVHCTGNMRASAIALATFFKADQKEEHRTLKRYLRELDFHPNPQVEMLMGLCKSADVGIGEVKAEALVGQFGTVWNVLNAKPEHLTIVEGIGIKTAKALLRKVGRPDA